MSGARYRTPTRSLVGAFLALALVNTRVAAQGTTNWWPRSGTVLLAGGGLRGRIADDLAKRLIELAGGPEAHIVIIPTANPNFDAEDLRFYFDSLGARHEPFCTRRTVMRPTRRSSPGSYDRPMPFS